MQAIKVFQSFLNTDLHLCAQIIMPGRFGSSDPDFRTRYRSPRCMACDYSGTAWYSRTSAASAFNSSAWSSYINLSLASLTAASFAASWRSIGAPEPRASRRRSERGLTGRAGLIATEPESRSTTTSDPASTSRSTALKSWTASPSFMNYRSFHIRIIAPLLLIGSVSDQRIADLPG
jgi:hypothetical protein